MWWGGSCFLVGCLMRSSSMAEQEAVNFLVPGSSPGSAAFGGTVSSHVAGMVNVTVPSDRMGWTCPPVLSGQGMVVERPSPSLWAAPPALASTVLGGLL